MNFGPQQIKALCLDFPGAFEDHPFGPETTVYKVRATSDSAAKVFALVWFDGARLRVNLKCEPDLAEQLRETYPEVTPGYHMNKRHWNSVTLPAGWAPNPTGLQHQHIHDMIEDSYDLIVSALPKADRMLLGWSAKTN